MINDLSVSASQKLAEALVQDIMDNIDHMDQDSMSIVLRHYFETDGLRELLSALLCIESSSFEDWVTEVLQEPEPDPEY